MQDWTSHPRVMVRSWARIPLNNSLKVLLLGMVGLSLVIVGTLPVRAEAGSEPKTARLRSHPSFPSNSPSFSHAFVPPLGTASDYLPRPQIIAATYLLLSLSERTLYLYRQDTLLTTYSVAIGRQGWETPTGRFEIFQMQEDPTWEHPFTGELVPPGEANPLGRRWLAFWSDGTNAIGFHGTPDDASIGRAISHGCVRLHNHDVIELYDRVAVGTPVYVIP